MAHDRQDLKAGSADTLRSTSLSALAVVCITYGLVVIAVTALQWVLVEILTPFMMTPLQLLLWAVLGLLMLVSIIYFVARRRKNPRQARLPLLINAVVILILWFVPFTDIWLDLEFRMNKAAYQQVVRMVESGELPSATYTMQLPSAYSSISRGGDTIVDRSDGVTSIFFFTCRGVLDNFSGYMYRSNDTPPSEWLMLGDWVQIKRKQPYWFFCASR